MMAARLVRVSSSFITLLIVAEWRSVRISCHPVSLDELLNAT
jgi:hypothetical protein